VGSIIHGGSCRRSVQTVDGAVSNTDFMRQANEVDHVRCLASKCLMRSPAAVELDELPEAGLGQGSRAIGFQIYLLAFDRAPEAFDEDVPR